MNDNPSAVRFWRRETGHVLARSTTPFYLFASAPVATALSELDQAFAGLPLRHWLSCKTQPLAPLLRWWRRQGRPIEVVSEFELRAALAEGFSPAHILVNGPAKHRWLRQYPLPRLQVNFDSLAEMKALLPLARRCRWTAGLRLQTRQESDPADSRWPTQFGFTPIEFASAAKFARQHRLEIAIVHFHLRTNVPSARIYGDALDHVADVCASAGVAPRYLDCGGGFPPPAIEQLDGSALDAQFSLPQLAPIYRRALRRIPSAQEVWLESGRWLTARSGVLVTKILEVKNRPRLRALICDGGRTLNALLSQWEQHRIVSLPARTGAKIRTTVYGPTCMSFDQLRTGPMPRTLRPGDHLLWLDAGAYHLSWETHFSHGLAAVWWHEAQQSKRVRAAEKFSEWWGRWK